MQLTLARVDGLLPHQIRPGDRPVGQNFFSNDQRMGIWRSSPVSHDRAGTREVDDDCGSVVGTQTSTKGARQRQVED